MLRKRYGKHSRLLAAAHKRNSRRGSQIRIGKLYGKRRGLLGNLLQRLLLLPRLLRHPLNCPLVGVLDLHRQNLLQ